MSIRFIAMAQTTADRFRANGLDANGQNPEHHISPADGYPCRCCLRMINKGEPYLILAYRPFSAPQPYAEIGPIFLHGETCHEGGGAEIPEFLASPRYLIRGYGADERIIYGSGRIVDTRDIPVMAKAMFDDTSIAFIHVRSASNNCYHCRIVRA